MLLDRVKALCKEKGVTLGEMREACGIGNGTMNKWDKTTPSLTNLKSIADYFDIPICSLIEEYYAEKK